MNKTHSPNGQVIESDDEDTLEALRQLEEQQRIHAEQVATFPPIS